MLKKLLLAILFSYFMQASYAQCFPFAFESGKWSINIEGGSGLVLLSDYGNGWEVNYGGGFDWAPFKKLLYLNFSARHVQQFMNDKTPNYNIFTEMPNEIDMQSNFFRMQVGMKLRLDWWFKKVYYEGIHPFIAISYTTDKFLSEETELHFDNSIESTSQQFSKDLLAGEQYELGFSWVFNENVKWDLSGYIYDQVEYYSIIKNGITYYPSSKLGLGLNTGVYLRF